jgi:hypothetical protein
MTGSGELKHCLADAASGPTQIMPRPGPPPLLCRQHDHLRLDRRA